ncbi:uncharacterized protein [Salvelinus alpinus]|uniref:uncharacterized protein isoform X2 n=1 Tax=Salvelinus alpinus TaxID=8036 RepID=UPI0039FD0822
MGRLLQNLHNNNGTLATFSLPPRMTYPVQIPAGVTAQTASALQGQLYSDGVPGSSWPQPSPLSSRRGSCSGAERSSLRFPAVSCGGPFYCPQDHDPSEDRTVLPVCGPSHSCTSDTRAEDPDTSSPCDASGPAT